MRAGRLEHPLVVRLCHWLSALATAVLIGSGLELFTAFPSFGDKLPPREVFVPPDFMRLGGWLGGALQWHLTFAWLFLMTGIVYVTYQLASGNYRQVLFRKADAAAVWPIARYYLRLGPRPLPRVTYNPLQKLAYTCAIALGLILVASGLALHKPVQLSLLVTAFGGLRPARLWHFLAMSGLLAFIPAHVALVALHGWSNFASMWTGTKASGR
jgi:Ni/Fe-hydrogenase b-type cytochrome subunit